MNTRSLTRLAAFPTLVSLIFAFGCSDRDIPTAGDVYHELSVAEAPAFPGGEALKVLTRNMYMGGDVGLVFGADLTDPAAVAAAATAVWGQIQATDFWERAQALAAEIDEHRPHLVAIQEIPRYVVLNGAFQPVGLQDHLGILQAELAGLPYTVAEVQENTTAVMPVILETGLHYIQYTDRIAILVRDDLTVTDTDRGTYQAHYQLAPALDLQRGWIRVSANVGGVPYHFLNTHLEVQAFAPVQAGQVQELLQSVMAGLDGVTVLVGDLNSDAEAGSGAPSWTPSYGTLIDAGFQDAWKLDHPGRATIGYTCCQEKELLNATSDLDERIDFVLIRSTDRQGSQHRFPGSIHVERVGEDEGDQTDPTGLWPSDHAGLLASFKVPSDLFSH
ncbi:MAG: endonuclease/exonuclease/phosphatase family protein [Longimicrobiales bacterium]